MRKKIIYIADDGKEFSSESDCIQYEFNNSYEQLCKNLVFYDEDFNIINKHDFNTITESFYVYVGDENAIEATNLLYEHFGFIFPDHTGYFYYNWDTDEWHSLDKRFNALTKELKNIKQKIAIMKEKRNGII